ncbi:CapA family protein [Chloroflexota bacterium]
MSDSNRVLSLTAVGDIYINVGQLHQGIAPRRRVLDRADPVSAFAFVLLFLKQQDFLFGNLECPLSDRGTPALGKESWLRSHPSAVEALLSAGFDAVGLANNHTLDFGSEAMLQTIEVLENAGIGYTGAGNSRAQAHQPAIIEKEGTRVAFLSYSSVFMPGWEAKESSPGMSVVKINTFYQPPKRFFEVPGMPAIIVTSPDQDDITTMKNDLEAAKKQADIVVVSWHWGRSEGLRGTMDYQVEMAHVAIDSGADLIFGHHSHAPQGVEVYKGKSIFYSMGNLVMDFDSPFFANETIITRCSVRGKRIEEVSFLPVRINEDFQPKILDTLDGKDIVDLVLRNSENFDTAFSVEETKVVINFPAKAL